jgi:hypothetical protein
MNFLYQTARTQFSRSDFLEPGDNPGASRHRHQLYVHAANPTNGGQIVL